MAAADRDSGGCDLRSAAGPTSQPGRWIFRPAPVRPATARLAPAARAATRAARQLPPQSHDRLDAEETRARTLTLGVGMITAAVLLIVVIVLCTRALF